MLLLLFLSLARVDGNYDDLDPPAKSVGCKVNWKTDAYDGMLNVTESGYDCMPWSATEPWEPLYGQSFTHNYCRNADGIIDAPWCYTMDSSKRWEACDVGTVDDPICVYKAPEPTIEPTSSPSRPPTSPTSSPTLKPATTKPPSTCWPNIRAREEETSETLEESSDESGGPSRSRQRGSSETSESSSDESGEPSRSRQRGRGLEDLPESVQRILREQRIVNGNHATPHEFPFLAMLVHKPTNNKPYEDNFCGGALIDPNWVLTAAHCLEDDDLKYVVIGAHRTYRQYETDDCREVHTVKRYFYHENYDKFWTFNDIGLIELDTPSNFPTIEAFRFQPGVPNYEAEGTMLTVAGWGMLGEPSAASAADILQKVNVPVYDQSKCHKDYGNNEPSPFPDLGDMICAGFETGFYDSCQGDSGGPLFNKHNGVFYQIGLVSWGIGCARREKPGVYTRISRFHDWVCAQIGSDKPYCRTAVTENPTSGTNRPTAKPSESPTKRPTTKQPTTKQPTNAPTLLPDIDNCLALCVQYNKDPNCKQKWDDVCYEHFASCGGYCMFDPSEPGMMKLMKEKYDQKFPGPTKLAPSFYFSLDEETCFNECAGYVDPFCSKNPWDSNCYMLSRSRECNICAVQKCSRDCMKEKDQFCGSTVLGSTCTRILDVCDAQCGVTRRKEDFKEIPLEGFPFKRGPR